MVNKHKRLILYIVLSVIFLTDNQVKGEVPASRTVDSKILAAEKPQGPKVSVIRLKNGGELTGVVGSRNEKFVELDLGFGEVSVAVGDIERIEDTDGRENDVRTKEFNSHVLTTQQNEKKKEENKKKYFERINEAAKIREESAKKGARIKFSDSSSIIVSATLNKKVDANFVVDTGANLVVISDEVARELNLRLDQSGQKIKLIMANGTTAEGTPFMLDSVKLGDAEAEHIQGAVAKCPEGVGILGMSFLKNFEVNIDNKEKVLILKNK